jgi:hypothetical protein
MIAERMHSKGDHQGADTWHSSSQRSGN